MRVHLRKVADELMQLALWLELLSRQEEAPTQEQINMISSRVRTVVQNIVRVN